jgi:protein-tyrosine-phosphatase
MGKHKEVVVVCTGNSCRSPVAEGLLKEMFRDHPEVAVLSAGTAALPGAGATPEAILTARELGINIRGHLSRQMDREIVERASLVIALAQEHARWLKEHFPHSRAKVITLGELARGDKSLDIADPIGSSLETYREVAKNMGILLHEAHSAILERLRVGEYNQMEGNDI